MAAVLGGMPHATALPASLADFNGTAVYPEVVLFLLLGVVGANRPQRDATCSNWQLAVLT